MSESIAVFVTIADRSGAERLAREAVEGGWAACVNIIAGLRSIYRWEGQVRQDPECLMILKTTRRRLEGLTAFLVARHDNEVPEVIALPIVGGYAPYLSWIADETAGEETP
jgi:periplasmic divalent cation tolerance protein